MGFFSGLMWRFRQFMTGRCGTDLLSRDLSWLALIFMLLSTVTRFYPLYLLGLMAFAFSLFRMLSRNLSARRKENMWYYARRAAVTGWFAKLKRRRSDRKHYQYYACPSCRQQLRVPRRAGSGKRTKIEITCPKCAHRFIRKR